MPRVVRMMAHVETDLPRADITHVYLHGAAALRRDLTRVRAVPDELTVARRYRGPVARRRRRAARHVGRAGRCDAPASRCGSPTSTTSTSARPAASVPACRRPRRASAQLIVVAVPPDHIAAARRRRAGARRRVVTDVGSVKSAPLDAVARPVSEAELARYVGSHPMAGSERSGPLAASAALFDGRPWAITPHVALGAGGRRRWWSALARLCGAEPVRLSPVEHDRAVARTSHLPHLLAVLTAGPARRGARPSTCRSRGQGVRDVTRIAGGDPDLWGQIIARATRRRSPRSCATSATDLDAAARRVLDAGDRATARRRSCDRGVAGTRAIPGKHGGPARPTASRLRLGARPPRRAGPAVRRRRRDRRQHRGRPHRPRPGRPVGLVELLVDETRAESPAGLARGQGLASPTGRSRSCDERRLLIAAEPAAR